FLEHPDVAILETDGLTLARLVANQSKSEQNRLEAWSSIARITKAAADGAPVVAAWQRYQHAQDEGQRTSIGYASLHAAIACGDVDGAEAIARGMTKRLNSPDPWLMLAEHGDARFLAEARQCAARYSGIERIVAHAKIAAMTKDHEDVAAAHSHFMAMEARSDSREEIDWIRLRVVTALIAGTSMEMARTLTEAIVHPERRVIARAEIADATRDAEDYATLFGELAQQTSVSIRTRLRILHALINDARWERARELARSASAPDDQCALWSVISASPGWVTSDLREASRAKDEMVITRAPGDWPRFLFVRALAQRAGSRDAKSAAAHINEVHLRVRGYLVSHCAAIGAPLTEFDK
ncbi:hypothetical protein HY480_04945, partial [Candidatus Uhrbacteria bacterium]|nr:hypothetical protein [Candidatus Uhrbacteria bacterium]